MKKLLILVDKISEKKAIFSGYIEEHIKDTKVFLLEFKDVVINISPSNTTILVGGDRIEDFDIVYFKRAGNDFINVASALAAFLKSKEIIFFDRCFKDRKMGNKMNSQMILALNNLPVIRSIFYPIFTPSLSQNIISDLGLPLVAKRLDIQKGEGVFLIKDKDGFQLLVDKFSEEGFLFQPFYERDKEYRLLVLGDTVAVFEEKIQKNSEEFRSNVALGAVEKFLKVEDMPPEMGKIAVSAAKALGYEIAGVDILVDKGGKLHLIEVNRGPSLTLNPRISPELDAVASFFAKELGVDEK